MRRMAAILIAILAGLYPSAATAAPGGAVYGDPPGWCTRFSDMWTQTLRTNDPLVANNPERDTFYGFHPDPGYDDWYGFFYGDFRGTPGDSSGWVKLLHETYPNHYSWNFAGNGWAVHGHAKQYIAYYNWTFGGQCGLGRYGNTAAPPYMADQYGWPVVDIYVDAVAPYPAAPRVIAASSTSVSFTWDPVADRGDGAGQDYFEAGMDHYTSWTTVDGGAPLQRATTAAPRTIVQAALPGQNVCVHVVAVDAVGNATPDESVCAHALTPPPMPDWPPLESAVTANPGLLGLVGLDSWLWLNPVPAIAVETPTVGDVQYRIVATPGGADWTFGDGDSASLSGRAAFGVSYPAHSQVTHVFQAHSRLGYAITANVTYSVTWSELVGGSWFGPYPMGTVERPAIPLVYPVEQAQPEVVGVTG